MLCFDQWAPDAEETVLFETGRLIERRGSEVLKAERGCSGSFVFNSRDGGLEKSQPPAPSSCCFAAPRSRLSPHIVKGNTGFDGEDRASNIGLIGDDVSDNGKENPELGETIFWSGESAVGARVLGETTFQGEQGFLGSSGQFGFSDEALPASISSLISISDEDDPIKDGSRRLWDTQLVS